jgi:hypothetical protein
MIRVLSILILASCSSLPPPGSCEVATTGNEVVDVVPVALAAGPATFDDLRFSPQLGKVVAAPEGTGQLFIIDPDTLEVLIADVPRGSGSADANATTVFVADRDGSQIVAIDAVGLTQVAAGPILGSPDYVRVAPTTGEVWVVIPGRSRLEILDPRSLAPIGSVIVSDLPEGLTFDDSGRAYVNTLGTIVAIDVARRVVVGEWDRGCAVSHGFPQVDETYGLAIGGCFSNGGVGVVTMDGDLRAGFEAGGGEAVLAYDHSRHHLYLRGDPGSTLDILATCSNGQLGLLASVPVPNSGHVSSSDDRGHVWVADATTGGVLLVTDPFPGTNR